MTQRVGRSALALVIGAVLVSAGVAWACTPSASLTVNPGKAPAGSQVTVTGSSFADGPVQVHWNDADGPVIGNATGPRFTISVRVPDQAPDVYYIVAVGRDAAGEVVGNASTVLEIPGPATSQKAPESPAAEPTSPSPNQPEAPAVVGGEPVEAAPVPPAATTRAQRQPRAAAQTPRAAAPAAGATITNGPAPAAASSAPAASAAQPEAAAAPSARTAGADLWSGFADGTGAGFSGPGLLDRPTPVSHDSGGFGLGLGLLVLAGAVMATAAGAAVIPARRRATAAHRRQKP